MEDSLYKLGEARIKFAASEAERVRNECGCNELPVCLNDIVQRMGIEVHKMDLEDKISGYTREGVIIYNMNHHANRQRFTIAHEIGHIVLDHTPFIGKPSQQIDHLREQEANVFASELLIPNKDIRSFMKSKDRTIKVLAERYHVSEDAIKVVLTHDTKLLNLLKI